MGVFDLALGLLMGAGLAASAGLNAYIPLLVMGLLARYTDLIELHADWAWLAGGTALVVLAVLLAVEVVADKVPVVDHVNDVLQTVVRPTSGGVAFGASSASTTVAVEDPATVLSDQQWIPLLIGAAIALAIHLIKAAARAAVNTMTVGLGAPVVSTAEDATSLSMSVVAIVLPVLVIFFLIGLIVLLAVVARKQARQPRRLV